MNANNPEVGNLTPIEEKLAALYTTPEPDARFAAALEQRLLKQLSLSLPEKKPKPQPVHSYTWSNLWPGWFNAAPRQRWATAALVVLLVSSLALAVIGPQRAWAAIQQWLGYVPGVGFVELEGTAVLPEPVTVTQAGITVHVEQVLARPHKTTIVFRSEGLPEEDVLWPEMMSDAGDYHLVLHLPDGQTLTTESWTLRLGGGTLEFPPLPAGVTEARLEIGRLPLVPSGFAPERWIIPFAVQPATPALIAALYPYAYTPANAAATQHGITVHVLEAAHTPEETALHLHVEWPDSDWRLFHLTGGHILPYLEDETGQTYHYGRASSSGSRVQTVVRSIGETVPAPQPEQPAFESTIHFQPVSPAAQQLTLVVDGLEFQVATKATFSLDLGPSPQIGDSWPLDLHLDVVGFPVHLTAARIIVEELDHGPAREPLARIALQFDLAPIPEVDGRSLWAFGLNGAASGFTGTSGSFTPDSGHRQMAVTVGADEPLPTGPVTITVPFASIVQQGPWVITWTAP